MLNKTILGKSIASAIIDPSAPKEARDKLEEIWMKVGSAISSHLNTKSEDTISINGEFVGNLTGTLNGRDKFGIIDREVITEDPLTIRLTFDTGDKLVITGESSGGSVTPEEVRALISATSPISYSNTTGVISHVDSTTIRHVTDTQITNWTTAYTNNHTHSNKANLDTINQDLGTTSSPTFVTVTAALSGNASTATTLQTARTIQGVSFDGSANINIINGTGLVRATGTALSYDNTTYLPSASYTPTAAILSGYVAVSGTITNTDTIETAIEKLGFDKHTNTEAGHSWYTTSVVTNKLLTGYSAASGTISATDSILTAFNKLGFDKHVAVTLATNHGLSLTGQVIGMGTPSSVTNTSTNSVTTTTHTHAVSGLTTSNLSATAGITNAQLANSSITIGTTAISLGSSSTTLAGLSSVTSTSFVGALTGNASTASTLQTSRTISLTGDVTGSASFNGGSNAAISATIDSSFAKNPVTYTTTTTTSEGYYRIATIPMTSTDNHVVFNVRAYTATGTETNTTITANLAYYSGDYSNQYSALFANTSHSNNTQTNAENGYVLLNCRISFDAINAYIDVYKYKTTAVTIKTTPLTQNDWSWATGALTVNPTVGAYRNTSVTLHAGQRGSSMDSASADVSTYTQYGKYLGTTISNTTDKTDQWSYYGYIRYTYNGSYLNGHSIALAIKFLENSESNNVTPEQLEDFTLHIKSNLDSHANATEFNTLIPSTFIEIEGKSNLVPETDVAAVVYSTSTTEKIIRLYVKNKTPNKHYQILPDNRFGSSYTTSNTKTTSYCVYIATTDQTTIASLPTPAQGAIVTAVRKSNTALGSVISEWTSYTPTFTGFGTPTNINFKWRRVGSSMEIKGTFTSGVATGVEARISIPEGYITTSNTPTLELVGSLGRSSATGAYRYGILNEQSKSYVTIGVDSGSTSILSKALATSVASSTNILSFYASIPISGWSASTNLITDFQEFASNSSVADANDLTSFVNGPDGSSALFTFSGARIRQVRFTRPIQPTDKLYLEFYDSTNKRWLDGTVPVLTINGADIINNGNGVTGALFYNPASALPSTDVQIRFFTYRAGTSHWSAGIGSLRWRVRKISNGNSAEAVPTGIYESGSNANGYYVKYVDGTMEQWGTTATISCTTLVGNNYYGSAIVLFPQAFADATYSPTSSAVTNTNLAWSSFTQIQSSSVMTIFRVASTSGESGKVAWSAIGKWNNALQVFSPGALVGITIEDSGSNSNGNYVKFSDGTLIQYTPNKLAMTGTGAQAARDVTWTFPMSFVDATSYAVSWYFMENTSGVGYYNSTTADSNTYSTSCAFRGYATSTGASYCSAMAIGRWK